MLIQNTNSRKSNLRLEFILNSINNLSVGQKNIKKNGFYTHHFKDRHGNQITTDIKLKDNQRVVVCSHLMQITHQTRQVIRTALKNLAKSGSILIENIYKFIGTWKTKEIIGQLITIQPVTTELFDISIKVVSLLKRKKINKTSSINLPQKSNQPRAQYQNVKTAISNQQNVYSNNKTNQNLDKFIANGIKIKSKDINFLDDHEKAKVENFKKLEQNIKVAIKKANTLKKQKQSELNRELNISITIKKQELMNQRIKETENQLNQKSINMANETILKNQRANAFDSYPKGKYSDAINTKYDNSNKLLTLDKEEAKSIKVDEDNLIPAKYKQNYLAMNMESRKNTIWLYNELNATVGIKNNIGKQKLIRSIMKKYWSSEMTKDTVKKYTDEIRRIKGNHYKEARQIEDYWGLFMKINGCIGNAVQQNIYEFDDWDSR